MNVLLRVAKRRLTALMQLAKNIDYAHATCVAVGYSYTKNRLTISLDGFFTLPTLNLHTLWFR